MADNIVNLTPENAAVAEVKLMHHKACDEFLVQAIAMFSFMELCRREDDEDFTMHGASVAEMAEVIVQKLRKAQEHHRESL